MTKGLEITAHLTFWIAFFAALMIGLADESVDGIHLSHTDRVAQASQ